MTKKLDLDMDGTQTMDIQMKKEIRNSVNIGDTKPGTRLPTVRELAVESGLNANVMDKLLHNLQREGYVSYKEGTGTYAIGNSDSGEYKLPDKK